MSWVYRLLRGLVRIALRFYYADVEIRGRENVPEGGPLLVIANHHISLVDPLLLISQLPRPVRFIAKAPLFHAFVVGYFLKKMNCIPAYRTKDPGFKAQKNVQLFRNVAEALAGGGAVGIFPEGISHDDPALADFKDGAARMALSAQEKAEGGTTVHILPVGIHFEKTRLFRGRLLISIGKPIDVSGRKEAFLENRKETMRGLTAEMQERLSRLVLDAENMEEVRLAELVAEMGFFEGAVKDVEEAFERKKRILDEYRKMQETHPESAVQIRRKLADYADYLDTIGGLPEKSGWGARAGRVFFNLLVLCLGSPFLAWGLIVNGIPYWLTRILAVIRAWREERGEDVRAGTGLIMAMFVFPVWYAGLAVAGVFLTPLWIWIPLLSLGPVCGVIALRWLERWRRTLAETWSLLRSLGAWEARREADRRGEELKALIENSL